MTLSEASKKNIGQHFVLGFHEKEITDEVRTLICEYYVGHFILMKRNVQDALQTRRLIEELQELAKQAGHEMPLLIGTDQENGLVSPTAGTQYPGAMALAATGSIEIAEKVASASGRELATVGINWAYSPVADVNSNPLNPVIGVRSFGDDPKSVSQFTEAVSRGMVESGVASCAKHFPGHGDTHVDSHLALPVIPKSLSELHATELIPFQSLIASGIPSIMTAHVALPNITGDLVPSSMSRKITTDLLRRDLGYEGVVVTDCLEMDAAMEEYGTERAALESLKAGADIAMICHTMEKQIGAIKLVYDAVESGELPDDELTTSLARIKAFKKRFVGTWDSPSPSTDDDHFRITWSSLKSKNQEISRQAYRSSVAIVNDPKKTIPLGDADQIVLFTPEMESLNRAVDDAEDVIRTERGYLRNTAGASYIAFANSLLKRAPTQHIVYNPSTTEVNIRGASTLIFTLRNADRSTWQINYLKSVLGSAILRHAESPLKIIVLSSCTPYDLVGFGATSLEAVAYVASFEFTASALETVTEVIFGETEARGRVPVLKGEVI
ncbi:hypothetical protein ONZ45_g6367 [Pleurotus djamor]|nr:hypothetical protein ONZ45_g6367 [Pleurotus djamor]